MQCLEVALEFQDGAEIAFRPVNVRGISVAGFFSGYRVFSKSKVKKVKLFIAKKQFESATVRSVSTKCGLNGLKGLKVL